MFIRIFIINNNFNGAEKVLLDVINLLPIKIKKHSVDKLEQYWKFEEMIVLESNIKLDRKLTEDEKKEFALRIGNNAEFYGDPIEEFLISLSADDIEIYNKYIYMIDIYF